MSENKLSQLTINNKSEPPSFHQDYQNLQENSLINFTNINRSFISQKSNQLPKNDNTQFQAQQIIECYGGVPFGAGKRQNLLNKKSVEPPIGFFQQDEDISLENVNQIQQISQYQDPLQIDQSFNPRQLTIGQNQANNPTPKKDVNDQRHQSEVLNLFKNQKIINSKRNDNKIFIWRKFSYKIIMLVNRFLFTLKKTLLFLRPHNLYPLQLWLINDKAAKGSQDGWGYIDNYSPENNNIKQQNLYHILKCCYKNLKKKQLLHKYRIIQAKLIPLRNFLSYLIDSYNNIPTINPLDNLFYRVWQIFLFISTIAILVGLPIINAFIELQVSMHSQLKNMQLFAEYAKNRMLFDIISSASILTVASYPTYSLIFYIRIFYFSKILDQLKDSVLLNELISGIINMLTLFSKVLFMCHNFACIWYYIGQKQCNESNSGWLVEYNLQYLDSVSKYLNSFYYSVITMATVGYGDISPKTEIEKFVVIIMVFICCGMFGYTINSIGSILMDIGQKEKVYKQKLAEIKMYLHSHNVENKLQNQAVKYIEYIYKYENSSLNQSNSCLNILCKYLKEEIYKNIFYDALQKISFFQNNFSKKCLEMASLSMKEIVFGPDEVIIDREKLDEPSIYFVANGEVEMFLNLGVEENKICKTIQTFNDNQYFGELEFFTNSKNRYISYKSVGISRIYKLNLIDFKETLNNFIEERENFVYLADCITLYKQYDKIQQYCYSCKQSNHLLFQCPYLFYNSDQPKLIKEILSRDSKFRKSFVRKKVKKSYNSLKRNTKICLDANKYLSDNFSYIFSSEESIDEEVLQQQSLEENNSTIHIHDSYKSVISNQQQQDLPSIEELMNQQKSNRSMRDSSEIDKKMSSIVIEQTSHHRLSSYNSSKQVSQRDSLMEIQEQQELEDQQQLKTTQFQNQLQQQLQQLQTVSQKNIIKTQKKILEQKIQENYQLNKPSIYSFEEIKDSQDGKKQKIQRSQGKKYSKIRFNSKPLFKKPSEKISNKKNFIEDHKLSEFDLSTQFQQLQQYINKFQNQNPEITQSGIVNSNIPFSLDQIKNFKNYFPNNNVEQLEILQKKKEFEKLQKKHKLSANSKISSFNQK